MPTPGRTELRDRPVPPPGEKIAGPGERDTEEEQPPAVPFRELGRGTSVRHEGDLPRDQSGIDQCESGPGKDELSSTIQDQVDRDRSCDPDRGDHHRGQDRPEPGNRNQEEQIPIREGGRPALEEPERGVVAEIPDPEDESEAGETSR